MATITFDTLKFARKLEAGGFTAQQAAAAAEALSDSLTGAAEELAHRADIADLRRDLGEMELRLRKDIAESKSDTLKWMFGAMVAQTALVVGLIKLIP
jgi:hypothetical protein